MHSVYTVRYFFKTIRKDVTMKEKNCVFCAFDPRYIIEENVHSFGAYFSSSIKRGHIIVALKDHICGFSYLSDEQVRGVFSLAHRLAKKAQALIGAEKYYIASIADVVPHFHVHLLPRMAGDPSIGPFIMGDTGWKGQVGQAIHPDELLNFIKSMQAD